jgi:hypothetical protein
MPKLGEKQNPEHPWCKRRDAKIAAREAATAQPKGKPVVWVCPSCGDELCEFEECLGVGDEETY